MPPWIAARTTLAALALVALGCLLCGCPDKGCDGMPAGIDRDTCRHDELLALPAAEIAQVQDLATRIEDPVIHDAALHAWIVAHAGEVEPKEAKAVCQSLGDSARHRCLRRITAAHLTRPEGTRVGSDPPPP